MKIAMWSGPRNLSTAMMYSFDNRTDCAVWDEPFYAPYLRNSQMAHPMSKEIVSAHESDPNKVAKTILGAIPDGRKIWYMKHMPHHMLDDFPLDWAKSCINVHLIRHPARVIASYADKRANISLSDIGFPQQRRLYKALGGVIVDSADVRNDPEEMLRKLCSTIGIPFDPAMLSWETGPRKADGVWAQHWYDAVHKSTGFAGPEGELPKIPEHEDLLDAALPFYEEMAKSKL